MDDYIYNRTIRKVNVLVEEGIKEITSAIMEMVEGQFEVKLKWTFM